MKKLANVEYIISHIKDIIRIAWVQFYLGLSIYKDLQMKRIKRKETDI